MAFGGADWGQVSDVMGGGGDGQPAGFPPLGPNGLPQRPQPQQPAPPPQRDWLKEYTDKLNSQALAGQSETTALPDGSRRFALSPEDIAKAFGQEAPAAAPASQPSPALAAAKQINANPMRGLAGLPQGPAAAAPTSAPAHVLDILNGDYATRAEYGQDGRGGMRVQRLLDPTNPATARTIAPDATQKDISKASVQFEDEAKARENLAATGFADVPSTQNILKMLNPVGYAMGTTSPAERERAFSAVQQMINGKTAQQMELMRIGVEREKNLAATKGQDDKVWEEAKIKAGMAEVDKARALAEKLGRPLGEAEEQAAMQRGVAFAERARNAVRNESGLSPVRGAPATPAPTAPGGTPTNAPPGALPGTPQAAAPVPSKAQVFATAGSAQKAVVDAANASRVAGTPGSGLGINMPQFLTHLSNVPGMVNPNGQFTPEGLAAVKDVFNTPNSFGTLEELKRAVAGATHNAMLRTSSGVDLGNGTRLSVGSPQTQLGGGYTLGGPGKADPMRFARTGGAILSLGALPAIAAGASGASGAAGLLSKLPVIGKYLPSAPLATTATKAGIGSGIPAAVGAAGGIAGNELFGNPNDTWIDRLNPANTGTGVWQTDAAGHPIRFISVPAYDRESWWSRRGGPVAADVQKQQGALSQLLMDLYGLGGKGPGQ